MGTEKKQTKKTPKKSCKDYKARNIRGRNKLRRVMKQVRQNIKKNGYRDQSAVMYLAHALSAGGTFNQVGKVQSLVNAAKKLPLRVKKTT